MKNRVVIRLHTMVSYAGYIINQKKMDNKVVEYRIKPSDTSGISILIPTEEIAAIFYMDGVVLEGDELYHEHRF